MKQSIKTAKSNPGQVLIATIYPGQRPRYFVYDESGTLWTRFVPLPLDPISYISEGWRVAVTTECELLPSSRIKSSGFFPVKFINQKVTA